MHRQIVLLLGAGMLGLAQAQLPEATAAPEMPEVTAAPVLPQRAIEKHQIYAAPIGVDTQYLTMDGSSTKWIGVNTEYLTEEVTTTTIDNVETTTTIKQQLSVVTAVTDSDGVGVGDVTVLMADTIQDQLDGLVKDVAASCAAPAKLKKRDGMSCMINSFQGAAQNDETLALINPAEWDGFVLEVAQSAPEILTAAIQVLKSQAQKNKFAIMVAAAAAAGIWKGGELVDAVSEVPHKFVFDDSQFGGGLDEGEGETETQAPSTQPLTTTEPMPTTTTAAGCDPSATPDENSPACDDEDCQGQGKICQAEGEKHNCPCVKWTKKMVEGLFDKDWSDAQQSILKDLEGSLPDILPPQCFRNTHGDNFDGQPAAEPSAFCRCSSISAGGGMTEGNYATMSGEGDDACTYATMPTETISITMMATETGVAVTSCRMESSYGVDPYCTCNDNSMHGQITTNYLGTETTVCPDATATMSGIADGTPTEEPSCYPTHGPPHDDPANDELLKLCGTGNDQFAAVCNTKADGQIDVGCPYKSASGHAPINSNHYDAWFDKAEDAPPECDHIFVQQGDGTPDNGAYVDALCIPAFTAILEKCSWNGGEVKNRCGTFKYQSCPLGGRCQPGNPQSWS